MPASSVAAIPAAPSDVAAAHFAARLSFETDCADVHEALSGGPVDFVLIDARGSKAYAKSHVPGALNIPHREMTADRLAAWPDDTLFVVYCAGPHCNGADRGGAEARRARTSGQIDAWRHDRMGGRELSLRHRLRTGFAEGRIRCVNRRWFLALKGEGSLRPLCGAGDTAPTYPRSYQQI